MAQSALSVTASNGTPPTNFSSAGGTPPSIVPNYTKATYADPKNWGATNPITSPPPFADDGTAGALQTFAAATSALASGSADTAGGTGNPTGSTAGTAGTYPGGVLATAGDPPWRGTVPASSSVAHEGSGTEVTVLAPGNRTYNYEPGGTPTNDMSRSASCGPVLTPGTMPQPNALHASYAMWSAIPTITGVSAGGTAGTGTTALTITGTNYNRGSIVYVDGVRQTSVTVSGTSLTVANAPKRLTAGNSVVTVQNGIGGPITAGFNWAFT